ncbi:MAG: response regulator [Planctomycetota bacterium]|nr:MAG: response regulator [Planctomycetota bacterium]
MTYGHRGFGLSFAFPPTVLNVRFHPDQGEPGGAHGSTGVADGSSGSRLNLLLSYGGFSDNPWVDRLPRLLEPLGVRSLRAGTGTEATRVIQSYPIHIAVVDLGLPMDLSSSERSGGHEAGPRILELLRRLESPPPIVVVKPACSHRDDARQITAALRAGVYAVVDRPHGQGDLELMLGVLQRCLRRFYQNRWPGGIAS